MTDIMSELHGYKGECFGRDVMWSHDRFMIGAEWSGWVIAAKEPVANCCHVTFKKDTKSLRVERTNWLNETSLTKLLDDVSKRDDGRYNYDPPFFGNEVGRLSIWVGWQAIAEL